MPFRIPRVFPRFPRAFPRVSASSAGTTECAENARKTRKNTRKTRGNGRGIQAAELACTQLKIYKSAHDHYPTSIPAASSVSSWPFFPCVLWDLGHPPHPRKCRFLEHARFPVLCYIELHDIVIVSNTTHWREFDMSAVLFQRNRQSGVQLRLNCSGPGAEAAPMSISLCW